MKTTIQHKLKEIEQEYDIKILYACESGSRAWGFPSPDSDYDVRFVYAQQRDQYLSVFKKDDQISFPITDELDVYGWDIRKVLQLISKSNTTPFEWLQSPEVYVEDSAFKESLWAFCQHYFCPRSNVHHYLGIANGAMATKNTDEIKIKKLFYVLRPLLAALWCVEKDSIAPMSIFQLMELLDADLQKKVLSLIDLKSTASEGEIIEVDKDIKRWIAQTFDYCSKSSNNMEKRTFDLQLTDSFFRKIIENDTFN